MNKDEDSLDDVINSLAVSNILPPDPAPAPSTKAEYDPNDALQNLMNDLKDLVKSNASVLEEARRIVESTGDVDFFEVYSSVSKSQSEAIKNMVKIVTEKEKTKIAKELKERDLTLKEKVAEHNMGNSPNALPAGTTLNQQNIILSGSREEMFAMIKKMQIAEKDDKATEKPIVDV